jgi:hypothetical protein
MRRGVSPALLLEQTLNTSAWALDAASPSVLSSSARTRLLTAAELEGRWRLPEAHLDYLGLMLAAHYTTVATFVPTDVDTHIRYHIWQEIEDAAALDRAIEVLEEAAAWDVRAVSARVVDVPGFVSPVGLPPVIYGHAGEWFSVRAGALCRALMLDATDAVDRLIASIEQEVIHEAACFAYARAVDPMLALRIATTIAHNTGDLSRVIEAWPKETPRKQEHYLRYARLSHTEATGAGFKEHKRELELAGHVNKQVMAPENHRYLALREPRVLRRHRDFILPLGPFFEGWAAGLCRSDLDSRELGQVLTALIHGTESTPGSTSYYRAMAEIHRVRQGGLDGLAEELPARYRKLLQKGAIRDALRVPPAQWDARLTKSFNASIAAFPR